MFVDFRMETYSCAIFLVFLTLMSNSFGADILAIIPSASFSHQIPFRPLWRELAKRGHNITLITADPMRDPTLKNVKEIDMSYGYEILMKYKMVEIANNDSSSIYDIGAAMKKVTDETYNRFFQSPEGQNLIHNKDNHFDLLIVEAQLTPMIIFTWRYQIPFIGVSSLDCASQYHDTAGNSVHPVLNPDPNLPIEDIKQLTFIERLTSFLYSVALKSLSHLSTFPKQQKMLKHYFGDDVPTIMEIYKNMSMLFIATNPIFQPTRPLMPNTITIGNGMHMSHTESLPKELQKFLDDAKEGAIYFSLGSNIKGRHLNETTKNELFKSLSKLPYRVIWKLDHHKFENVPSHIRIEKWFSSQQDILRHPNVKLFITQGGLQSMQEAVYANKPMIGIPFFGDQHMNVKRMVHVGYGIKVHKDQIIEETIRLAVMEVMQNQTYTQKAQEVGAIFRDVDVPNVDKAVWWTEYVLRHKGARHFRNPMLDMPLWKIYLLDVLLVLLLGFIVILTATGLCLKTLYRLITYLSETKMRLPKVSKKIKIL